jgi:hypothetical protein
MLTEKSFRSGAFSAGFDRTATIEAAQDDSAPGRFPESLALESRCQTGERTAAIFSS